MTGEDKAREVTQADRDAAADIVRWQQQATREWKQGEDEAWQFFAAGFSKAIRQGIWDEHPLVQAFAHAREEGRLAALNEAKTDLANERAERELLQDILDSRPAINAGLPESYIRWSQGIYSGEGYRARPKPAKDPK